MHLCTVLLLLHLFSYCILNWYSAIRLSSRKCEIKLSSVQARQSGTRCQMNLEILTASIVLNGFWKQSSLAATSMTSASEIIFNEMRYINLRFTYLLTYLLSYLWITAIVLTFTHHLHALPDLFFKTLNTAVACARNRRCQKRVTSANETSARECTGIA